MREKSSLRFDPVLPVTLLAFLAFFLFMLRPYLLALLIGLLLAILTRPLYEIVRRQGPGSAASAGLVVSVVVLAVIVPLSLFAVAAVKQAVALAGYLSGESGAEFVGAAVDAVLTLRPVQWIVESRADLQAKGLEFARSAGGALSRILLLQAASLPDMVLKLTLSLLTWFFLLFEGEGFSAWLMLKVPMERSLRTRLAASFRVTAASTVWATSAAAAAQAGVVMLGFLALGIPNVFLAGGATFIFAWIPILGSLPVCLAGAVYLYFKGSLMKLLLMAAVAAVAGFMDNVVRPLVMKGRGDMHPLLALIAIFAGINTFGLWGVIFGPIVASMLTALLNAWQPGAEA